MESNNKYIHVIIMIIEGIDDLFIKQKYDKIINQLYNNYDAIESLIVKTNNPQIKLNMSLELALKTKEINLIPIVIKNLVYFIVKKLNKLVLKHEFKTKDIFYVNNCDNSTMIKLFILQILLFYYEAESKKNYFVGLDYEFNERKIALCQICLFPRKVQKYIWIINPTELNKLQTSILISSIYTSENIYKIVHGSDSLDIPYMFTELFDNNKEIIFKFTNKVIDTRFLCEYTKIINKSENKKCSIYDALLYFHTIDQQKYNKLNQINENMGPIQDINWNVHKMSSYHLKYAIYDVLFLKKFLFDLQVKKLSIIPEITRFIFLDKWVVNILDDIKKSVDLVNIYLVKLGDKNITMIQIYNDIMAHGFIKEINLNPNDLLAINYFKSSLVIIFKLIVYSIISHQFTVYISKTEVYHHKLYYKSLLKQIKDFKFHQLYKLLVGFAHHAKRLIELK